MGRKEKERGSPNERKKEMMRLSGKEKLPH